MDQCPVLKEYIRKDDLIDSFYDMQWKAAALHKMLQTVILSSSFIPAPDLLVLASEYSF